MSDELAPAWLARAGEFVARRLGLDFPPERSADLQRGLRAAARELGFPDTEAGVRWLLGAELTPEQVEILADGLTVGETYFYRDPRVFELLEKELLPVLIRARRGGPEQRLRCWSAACCTGEEAYTLADCIRRLLPDATGWHLSIQATDINARFLRKAAQGIYGEWSFRAAPDDFRARCFTAVDARHWQIAPELRAMVNFAPLNLAEDSYPSLLNQTNALDLIFCRNVLIYFSAEQTARVIRNLARCLAEGGWLILGPTDLPAGNPPGLVRVRFDGAILFRKDTTAAQAAGAQEWRGENPAPWPTAESVILDVLPSPVAPLVLPEPPVVAAPEIPSPQESPQEQAWTLYRAGRYAESAELLRAASSGGTSDEPGALHLLAHIQANQGRLDEAIACCDRLVLVDKMNPACHYLRASLLQEEGRLLEAAAAFKRALYLDGDFVLAHFALGNLARSQGQAGDAGRHFQNASTLARRLDPAAALPEAEGLTAGRLVEIIAKLREAEASV